GSGSHEFGDPGECARAVQVVGVQPADDLARAETHSLVDGVRLTVVRLTDHPEISNVAVKNRARVIGAAAVAHDVVNGRVTLFEHATNGALDESALIQAGGNDGDTDHVRLTPGWPARPFGRRP